MLTTKTPLKCPTCKGLGRIWPIGNEQYSFPCGTCGGVGMVNPSVLEECLAHGGTMRKTPLFEILALAIIILFAIVILSLSIHF